MEELDVSFPKGSKQKRGTFQERASIKKKGIGDKYEQEVYVFELCKKYSTKHFEPNTVYGECPPYYSIPNTQVVYYDFNAGKPPVEGSNAKTGKGERLMRYIKGQASVFADEQSLGDETAEHIEKVLGRQENRIEFTNGQLIVQQEQALLIEFLMNNNFREGSTSSKEKLFRYIDEDKKEKELIENYNKKYAAINLAQDAEDEDMIHHAKFLGISFRNNNSGHQKSLELIRAEYVEKATANPVLFMKYINNPNVKNKFYVEEGIEKGIITTDIILGQLHWKESKQFVTTLDSSKSKVDAILDFVATEGGGRFLEDLKKYLG